MTIRSSVQSISGIRLYFVFKCFSFDMCKTVFLIVMMSCDESVSIFCRRCSNGDHSCFFWVARRNSCTYMFNTAEKVGFGGESWRKFGPVAIRTFIMWISVQWKFAVVTVTAIQNLVWFQAIALHFCWFMRFYFEVIHEPFHFQGFSWMGMSFGCIMLRRFVRWRSTPLKFGPSACEWSIDMM